MSNTLHPSVPIQLHPGVQRPAQAAGREALGALYRAYATVEDAAHRPAQEAEVAAALAAVDSCLQELRHYQAVLVAAGGCMHAQLAAARRTIERVEAGKQLLQQRRRHP